MSAPKTPEEPKTPTIPDRQPVGLGDTFRLPSWISESDQKNYYYRWMRDDRWSDLQPAGYTQVMNPKTKRIAKKPTKDSDSDLILVRLPIQYRQEDLKAKADRVANNAKIEKGLPGVEAYSPKD